MANIILTYLEGFAEFVAHQVVQQWIDARRQVIHHARRVCNDGVEHGPIVVIKRDQTLRVKRRPAQDERHHNSDCNERKKFVVSASLLA